MIQKSLARRRSHGQAASLPQLLTFADYLRQGATRVPGGARTAGGA